MALLTLARVLRAEHGLTLEVLFRDGGELLEDFRAIAPLHGWPESPVPTPRTASALRFATVRRLWPGVRGKTARSPARGSVGEMIKGFCTRGISLVYSNTITNGEVLAALEPLNVPVVSHVHELDYWMRYRISERQLGQALRHTDLFIAASEAVARSLTTFGVPAVRIRTVHESIDIESTSPPDARAARARWRLPQDGFVVGLCGTMDWRKGVDLLAPLAAEVHRQSPGSQIHWMWVGGEREGARAGRLRHDFQRCEMESRLHLTGTLEAPREAFAAFDAFIVLSREDPFPLVMLEAASCGVPVLCFERAGGAPEFVRDDAGFVVPYLDLRTMAARVLELERCPERQAQLGATARQRVIAEHDAGKAASRILDIIDELIRKRV